MSYRLLLIRFNTSLELFVKPIEAYEISDLSAQFSDGVYRGYPAKRALSSMCKHGW